MDPRQAAKRYTRTAVCIINGAPNTAWDAVAAKTAGKTTGPEKPYYPVGVKTKFEKAHVEDTLAYAVRKYTNGTLIPPKRPTGNGGDNHPTVPSSSILNGVIANTPGELQEKIYVLGVNIVEGAIQAGGSGRTYNHEKLHFPPGTVLAGKVIPKGSAQSTDEDNMYLVPDAFDPKVAKFPLLDRMRTYLALEEIRKNGAFTDNTLSTDGKRVAHFLLDTLMVSETAAVDTKEQITQIGLVWEALSKSIDKGITPVVNIDMNVINRLDGKFKNLHNAYAQDASGTSSAYSRYIIEPLEKFVMDQIDVKNEASRCVFGITVAPVTANTMMIPFNFINYSR